MVHYNGNIQRLLPFRALNHIYLLIPASGPTTGEMLVDLLQHYPDGATIGELSRKLNRPVSMLLIVLKLLASEKKVRTQRLGTGWVYFLR